MSWLSDSAALVSGAWVSSIYSGHGILGANVPVTGTNGQSIISAAVTVDPAKEYRLFMVTTPAGFSLNEDGSGTASASGVATMRLYADGVEVD
jgi:hypothetical protein